MCRRSKWNRVTPKQKRDYEIRRKENICEPIKKDYILFLDKMCGVKDIEVPEYGRGIGQIKYKKMLFDHLMMLADLSRFKDKKITIGND